jgi:hypothetical protein
MRPDKLSFGCFGLRGSPEEDKSKEPQDYLWHGSFLPWAYIFRG